MPAPTRDGLLLAAIYADVDLIVSECLRRGGFDGLDAAELAGLCALFVYETRTEESTVAPETTTVALELAVRAALDILPRREPARRVRG